jgi:hypothetical protein
MMVEQRINSDEIECEENYTELSTFHPNREDANIENEHQPNDQQQSDLRAMSDNTFKYVCAAKKWNELYDIGVAIKLQDSLKRHLYTNSYGDQGNDFEDISDDFDPLKY